jgi:hypothetical protein
MQLVGVGEVRRRLDVRVGPHDQARHGDRGDVLLGGQVGLVLHRRALLGAEVLDDRLLHVPPAGVGVADGMQRLGAVAHGLADAEQQPRGERDAAAAGVVDHLQAQLRVLVGGAVVGAAGLRPQGARRRLEHHAHRRRDRTQALQLRPGHDAGVEVRQQPRLLEHEPCHRPHVVEGRGVAVPGQPLARDRPAVLGPVPEGEQRLLAAGRRTLAGDVEDLAGLQVGGLALAGQLARGVDEDAVVAPVTAQRRDRDEHLLRVRHHPGQPGRGPAVVAQPGGDRQQAVQVLPAGVETGGGLVEVRRVAVLDRAEGRRHLVHRAPAVTWGLSARAPGRRAQGR